VKRETTATRNAPRTPAESANAADRAARAAHPAPGFTIIEVLVAIGAIAVLAVSISQVFGTIGSTVTSGRRVSQLNAVAVQIETQMRRDFERMTRDGFMMIRHQTTSNGTGAAATAQKVALGIADANPRVRRIDEILFFAKGEFSSSREPAHPAYSATGQAARIYYGHGTRQPTDVEPLPARLNDINLTGGRLGQKLAGQSPNRFAADWVLVRHQCVLIDPAQSRRDLVPVLGLDPVDDELLMKDKDGQIGLQPASPSVFRHLAVIPNEQPATVTDDPFDDLDDYLRPGARRFSSGLVDIATTTLRDVRDVVMAARQRPVQLNPGTDWFTTDGPDLSAGGVMLYDAPGNGPFPNTQRMIEWMDSAWPTQSDQTRQFEPLLGKYNGLALQVPSGLRMRVDPTSANLLRILREDGKFKPSAKPKVDYNRSYLRADQMQLAGNAFLAGCTEFIVEWSFGEVDPNTSELIWYGLPRFADLDRDGVQDANEPMLTQPFPYRAFNGQAVVPKFAFDYPDASTGSIVTAESWQSTGVRPELIHGAAPPLANTTTVEATSHFGYLDPTSSADGRPWAWPEFVRVTISIVDPTDATREETFQFMFRTPGNKTSL
jgi:prepilin-type N-terminal cleavage/methylation domain-containing protein